ncbi:neutral zinc metallopeptidase [Yoonia sp.]|uniref:neutral zinc metallopeptidase n=1 Tax=Yoonia sp. TaxID=2212373 RepID=UPI0023838432|nr:neutral zinc metallopeptidase [Yoonia sp.]MDE0852185.1 neutral zinc metallopeptidase [Yoonia sp.]
MWKWVFVLACFGTAGTADSVDKVMAAAQASFERMPRLARVATIAGECGADGSVNQDVAYCTSLNTIFLTTSAAVRPDAAYLVAHVLGHAVQVQHGVADVALREITQRRSEEQVLRGYVASQVDCLAGFLLARAGLPPTSLAAYFVSEPFTGTHWGREPLRIGPQVAIGLTNRDAWFQRGHAAATLQDCAAGEFGADLLLRAYKG